MLAVKIKAIYPNSAIWELETIDSSAIEATVDLAPAPVAPEQIENGVIMTRLDVTISPSATVEQINSALELIGARIVFMRPQSRDMTVSIPRPGNVTELVQVASALNGAPGIAFALTSSEAAPKVLPPGTDVAVGTEIDHLLPTRFPAAWNAKRLALSNCQSNDRVTILVPDLYGLLPATHDRIFEEFPGGALSLGNTVVSNLEVESHGWDVILTMGALFDENTPTGAHPFSTCFAIVPISVNGLTYLQSMDVLVNAFPPVGKFLINYSLGFHDECTNACTPDQFPSPSIPSPYIRALVGLKWKEKTLPRWADFLLVSAAGNEGGSQEGLLYPGIEQAAFSSMPNIASRTEPLPNFSVDIALWGGDADFPSMTATAVQQVTLSQELTDSGLVNAGKETNVLIVGSTLNRDTLIDLDESVTSDRKPDVFAVGEQILPIGGPLLNGTSFSAPQVTALVAYLWSLSPELRGRPIDETRRAITAHTRANGTISGVIDAYASILSLDHHVVTDGIGAPVAPVREAILDVNDDGVFNQDDLTLFHTVYFGSSDGTTLLVPTGKDYGRHDLNGDGFTGGISIQRFDLDLVGSTQFAAANYGTATQMIDGIELNFNELALSDLQILCYYAYSPLYLGSVEARAGLLGTQDCVGVVQFSVEFDSVIVTSSLIRITLTHSDANGNQVPLANTLVELTVTGGTVASSGNTDANGVFQTTAIWDGTSEKIVINIVAKAGPNGAILAQTTVEAAAAPPSTLPATTVAWKYFGAISLLSTKFL